MLLGVIPQWESILVDGRPFLLVTEFDVWVISMRHHARQTGSCGEWQCLN